MKPGEPIHIQGQSPPSLVKKLCSVMAECTALEKTGRNEHFNYNFVEEAMVSAHIRPLLAKHGVFVTPSQVEEITEEVIMNTKFGDKKLKYTKVKVEYTFRDCDSDATITVIARGHGTDSGDKSLYKALTGCSKYFYLKTFNLGTEDDPEHDRDIDQRPQAVKKPMQSITKPAIGPNSLQALADTKFTTTDYLDRTFRDVALNERVKAYKLLNWIDDLIKDKKSVAPNLLKFKEYMDLLSQVGGRT